MKEEKIIIKYDTEKLKALSLHLEKESTSIQEVLVKCLDKEYQKKVPKPVQEFLSQK